MESTLPQGKNCTSVRCWLWEGGLWFSSDYLLQFVSVRCVLVLRIWFIQVEVERIKEGSEKRGTDLVCLCVTDQSKLFLPPIWQLHVNKDKGESELFSPIILD